MKTSIKNQWVEALRSGRYQQTQNLLRDQSGYCCLGVLCDLMPGCQWVRDGLSFEAVPPDCLDGSLEYPPPKVEDWSGFRSHARVVTPEMCDFINTHKAAGAVLRPGPAVYVSLAQLNDDYRLDFNQIADFIERFIPSTDDSGT